jgi:hypothetical protein
VAIDPPFDPFDVTLQGGREIHGRCGE